MISGRLKGQAHPVVPVAIIGLVVTAFTVYLILGGNTFQFFAGGFIVESIDPPSNNLGQWTISAVASQSGANRIVATVSPGDVVDISGSPVTTEFPITIEAVSQQEVFTFIPQNIQQPITRLRYEFVSAGPFGPNCNTLFPGEAPWTYEISPGFINGNPNIGGTKWCIKEETAAVAGNFPTTPSITRSAEISITRGGQTAKAIISNSNQAVPLKVGGQTVGQVTATGLLLTGTPQPDVSQYVPFFRLGGEWQLMNAFTQSSYTSQRATTVATIQTLFVPQSTLTGNINPDEVNSVLNNYNNFVDFNVLNQNVVIASGQVWESADSQSSGKLRFVSAGSFSSNLGLQLLLDADWVGFQVLSGEPDITAVSCPTAEAGDLGAVVMGQVRNSGEAPGAFAFTLEGCSFRLLGPETVHVNPGQTVGFSFPRTSSTTSAATQSCVLMARDIGGPQNEDAVQVTCTQTAPTLCTNGEFATQGNQILLCVDGELEVQETCPDGIDIVNGIPVCRGSTDPVEPPVPPGLPVDLIIIAVGVAAVAVISGYSPSDSCLRRNKMPRKARKKPARRKAKPKRKPARRPKRKR